MDSFWLAMVAAVMWGCSSFIEKWGLMNADAHAGVVARTTGVMLGCVVFIFLFPAAGRRFLEMEWRPRVLLMAGGVLASVVAQIFFYQALKSGEVGRVATIGGMWPLFAFFLSLLFLGETVTLRKTLGIVFIAAGAVLLR